MSSLKAKLEKHLFSPFQLVCVCDYSEGWQLIYINHIICSVIPGNKKPFMNNLMLMLFILNKSHY